MQTFKPLGELLKKLIVKSGLSQKELSSKSGVSTGYISDIMNRKKTKGSEEAIEKLLVVLNVTEDEKKEIWESYSYERGHKETLLYLKKIELKYYELLKNN